MKIDRKCFQYGACWVKADFHLHTVSDREFSFAGAADDFILNSQSVQSRLLNRYLRQTNIKSAFMEEIRRHWSFDQVHMYACTQGQGADEDSTAGGLYTTMLIGQAESWGRKVGIGNLPNCYSILDAHADVVAELRSQGSHSADPCLCSRKSRISIRNKITGAY